MVITPMRMKPKRGRPRINKDHAMTSRERQHRSRDREIARAIIRYKQRRGHRMSDINPNCDGAKCADPKGEVRLYKLGGGANLILCRSCWAHENWYRRMRAKDYTAMAMRQRDADQLIQAIKDEAAEKWPQEDWYAAEIYAP